MSTFWLAVLSLGSTLSRLDLALDDNTLVGGSVAARLVDHDLEVLVVCILFGRLRVRTRFVGEGDVPLIVAKLVAITDLSFATWRATWDTRFLKVLFFATFLKSSKSTSIFNVLCNLGQAFHLLQLNWQLDLWLCK